MTGPDLTRFPVGDGQRAVMLEGKDQDAVIRVLADGALDHGRAKLTLEEAERRVEQLLAAGQTMLVIVLGDTVHGPPERSLCVIAYHIPMKKP